MGNRCRECGRPITSGDYCSEGCEAKANERKRIEHLKKAKPEAEKCLKKWKKEVAKRNNDIVRLEAAIASDDPNEMDMACLGGRLGCLGKVLKFLFIVPSIGFWLIFAVALFLNVIKPMLSQQANDTYPSSQVESSATTSDYVAEYHTVAKAVVDLAISVNPDRKMQLLEAFKKNVEAFDKLSKEEQAVKLEKMKAKLKEMQEKTVNK